MGTVNLSLVTKRTRRYMDRVHFDKLTEKGSKNPIVFGKYIQLDCLEKTLDLRNFTNKIKNANN